ncbi:MAG: histone deacetylase [Polyangiaceae bacterium]|nr:histone deacetylase [Polyangiaceae bacterium]
MSGPSSTRGGLLAAAGAARHFGKRLRRLGLRWSLPGARIVFDRRYVLPIDEPADGRRAEKILRYLEAEGALGAATLLVPPPMRVTDALRVHDAAYLSSLDDPEVLESIFFSRGLGGLEPGAVLEAQRAATAGTVHAATIALRYPWLKSPVVNLGGGFHHARRAKGAGFCSLNDVAIAIDKVRGEGFDGTVLVVDLDFHHGDGTRSLYADDPTVFTYSIHAQSWDDSTAVAAIDVELDNAVGDGSYLKALDETLPEAFERARPKLVFYVAGADVAATDTLGSWRLTAGGMLARDRRVLERAHGVPTVMVLAGGYGREAWRYPARTLLWLLTGDDQPIPTSDEQALARFRRIRRSISSLALRNDPSVAAEDELKITDADIYGDLFTAAPERRFLGFYSAFGLEVAFERYGLAEHLRSRGYDGFVLDADSRVGSVGQGLRVYADASRKEVLIELVVSELYFEPGAKLMCIEWLLLQDPHAEPRKDPLLPGQKHPGLGCSRIVVGMLVMACERLRFDGLTLVPAHFHVAAVTRRSLRFLEPEAEALFLALAAATKDLPLAEASLAIESGRVRSASTGEVVRYEPARMVLPVSEAFKARLDDASYARRVEEAARGLELVLAPE